MTNTQEARSENNHISVRVEWSRFDKVTIKFTTVLTIMGVETRQHELIDRRLLKALKTISGTVEERCKVFANQKAEAVTEALRHHLAVLVQARYVQPQEAI